MTLADPIRFLIGLALLVWGAERLVRGASSFARRLGVPPLVIGLTVVAFGTSSPELAVSIGSSLSDRPEIALGNVVGSNIFNVLLILGASALITPLAVSARLVRFDVPVMIGVSALVLLLALNGTIGRVDGVLLLATGALYFFLLYRGARANHQAGPTPGVPPKAASEPTTTASSSGAPVRRGPAAGGLFRDILAVVLGLAFLFLGTHWLLKGAIAIATALGVSPLIIGLTIVAAGTSLPELVTSIAAAARKEQDIAVGNVVGSNVFNLLFVLGAAATLSGGLAVERETLQLDLPVMLAVAVACLPVFFTGSRIGRWEGLLFLAYYVAYMTFVALESLAPAVAPAFKAVMLGLVVPLTAVTLGVIAWRQWHATRRERGSGEPV
ncbi:MAG TPA: calcium/sodium antiporter [Longimicrobiales bacterium]|nr:calcium/sodium antiporter [Longimicrobiales bacterium]